MEHYVGVASCCDHLRGEDTGRAIEGREGLVQLGHVAPYGLLPLHKMHLVATFGYVQGRLNPCYSPSHNQHIGMHRHLLNWQWLVKGHPPHSCPHEILGLLVGLMELFLNCPGALLPDIGYLEKVGIYPS